MLQRLPQAQVRGQRQVHGSARLLSLRRKGQVTDGAHVVQAVGALDLKRASVDLPRVVGIVVDPGDVEEEVGDDVTELCAQLGRGSGVLGVEDVVQHCGDHGFRCRVLFGEDECDFDGVGDVGVAAAASLVAVGLLGDDQGAADGLENLGTAGEESQVEEVISSTPPSCRAGASLVAAN
jgi:hypothetical protein